MTSIFKGSTSRTIFIELVDATTGLPRPGVVPSDVVGSYARSRSGRVAIAATVQSVGGAFAEGGFVEIDPANQPGIYRLDVPNAAFAPGAEEVVVTVKAVGCRPSSRGFTLADNDLAAVRAKTDALTIGAGGRVDANITHVLDQAVPSIPAVVDARVVSMAADSVTASALSADALAEIRSGLATASQIPAAFTDATFSAAGVFAAASLVHAPAGGGSSLTSADVQAAMTAQGYTAARADLLDRLDAAISTRSTYAGGPVAGVSAPVSIDLTTAVPRTNVPETVGDALNAARAQGFGAWSINPSSRTLSLLAADGATVVRSFTIDDLTNPTSRA